MAAAWLREQRKQHSLEEIRASLRADAPALDEALTGAVKTEHGSLLGISDAVGGAEKRLRSLSAQLQAHGEGASGFVEQVSTRVGEFSAVLDQRAALLKQGDDVRLLRRLADALTNLEAALLLHPAKKEDDHAAERLPEDAARLRRASGECGRMLLLLKRASDLLPVQKNLRRIEAARATLLEQLGACLRRALEDAEGGDKEAGEDPTAAATTTTTTATSGMIGPVVADLLLGFAEADGEDEAAKWVRSEWVEPRLKPLLTAAAEARDATMASVAAVLESFIESPSFAPIALADRTSQTPLHLLAAGPWHVFCRCLGEGGHTHLFGAGMPDVFHAAYTAVNDASRTLEAKHLQSTSLIRHLRAHPETHGLRRRFNLPIYFQLRLQETTKPLEAALDGSEASSIQLLSEKAAAEAAAGLAVAAAATTEKTGGGLSAGPQGLTTAAVSALVVAIRRCVDPQIFLLPLSSRLLRLLLQCLARFALWLKKRLADATTGGGSEKGSSDVPSTPALAEPPAAAAPPPPPPSTPTSAAAPTASAATPGSAPPTPAAPPSTPHTPALSDANGATALYLDLVATLTWLKEDLQPALPSLLHLPPSGADALARDCSAALGEGLDALSTSTASLRTLLVDGQSSACANRLAPVRAIAQSYRMTGKALPTQSSYFILEVLKPLKGFLDAHLTRLPPLDRVEWSKEVANRVTSRYRELASSTLDMVRKDEEARERLLMNKSKGGGGGGGGGGEGGAGTEGDKPVSDSQKICVQLCLDVQAFASELSKVGIDAADLDDYASLQEAVRPDAGLLEAVVGVSLS